MTFDYDALDPVELSIREGQVIENVTTDESGWWKGTLNGQTGLFPHNFVVAIDAAAAHEALALQKANSASGGPLTSNGASAREEAAPPRPPRKNTAAGQGVNVLAAVGGMSELQAKLELKKKDYQKRDEPPLTLGAAAASPNKAPAPVGNNNNNNDPLLNTVGRPPAPAYLRGNASARGPTSPTPGRPSRGGNEPAGPPGRRVSRSEWSRSPSAGEAQTMRIQRSNQGKEELNRRETDAAVERQRRVDELSTKPVSANEQAVARAANEQRAAAQREAAARAEAERVEAERRAAALERDAKKAQAAKQASSSSTSSTSNNNGGGGGGGGANKRRKATEQQRSDKSRLGRASVTLAVDSRPAVLALYDYEPEEKGELAFRAGDRILVNVKDESGWWQGETSGGVTGWFPADFVSETDAGKLPPKHIVVKEAATTVAAAAAVDAKGAVVDGGDASDSDDPPPPTEAATPRHSVAIGEPPVLVAATTTSTSAPPVQQSQPQTRVDDGVPEMFSNDDSSEDAPPPKSEPAVVSSPSASNQIDDATDDESIDEALPPTPFFHPLAGTMKLASPLPSTTSAAPSSAAAPAAAPVVVPVTTVAPAVPQSAPSPLSTSSPNNSERRAPVVKPPVPKSAVPVKSGDPTRWPSWLPSWAAMCERLQSLCDSEARAAKSDPSPRVPLAVPRMRQIESTCEDIVAFAVCSLDGIQASGVSSGGGAMPPRITLQGCAWPFLWSAVVAEQGLARVRALASDGPLPAAAAAAASRGPANAMQTRGVFALLDAFAPTKEADVRLSSLLDSLSLAAGAPLQCSMPMYLSARDHAARDHSAAHSHAAAAAAGGTTPSSTTPRDHANQLHELFQQLCSVEVTMRDAATLAATVANGGVCPLNNERPIASDRIAPLNAMLLACGLNEASDAHRARFAHVPVKSGVSGLLLVVVPDGFGLALWSPRLTKAGYSKRAYSVLEQFLAHFPALAKPTGNK